MAVIVAGLSPGSREFAESLASASGADLIYAEGKVFPDGEVYVRVGGDVEHTVIVVQTMSRPQDTSIIQAMLLADALRGLGARRIILVSPYTAYARQDKRFLPGEPVSIAVVLRSLYTAGYNEYYTIEIHKEEALSAFPGSAVSLYPYYYMASKTGIGGDYLILAPDIGALRRVERLARSLGAQYDYLVKRRDRVTGEITIEPKHLDVKGRRVVIVDDIISTGGTVSKAARLLLEQGAESVEVLVAHAVLAGDALEKLRDSGVRRVVAGNTLPRVDDPLVEYVDLAPLVAGNLSV